MIDKKPIPFHEWKDKQLTKDKAANNGVSFFRAKEWYWSEYGRYIKKLETDLTEIAQ